MRPDLNLLIDITGWLGAGLILLSYILLSIGKVDARTPAYQWMNVVGAIAFIINSGWHGAIPSAVLNIIWTGIGIYALTRIARANKRP